MYVNHRTLPGQIAVISMHNSTGVTEESLIEDATAVEHYVDEFEYAHAGREGAPMAAE